MYAMCVWNYLLLHVLWHEPSTIKNGGNIHHGMNP